MTKFLFSSLLAIFLCGCSYNKEAPIDDNHIDDKELQTSLIDHNSYYELVIPGDFKKRDLPNLNNAFNVYPDLKNKTLRDKCTMQFLSDIHETVPTKKRKYVILHNAISQSRNFITKTMLNKQDLAISKIDDEKINNLSGFSFEVSSVNPEKFFLSKHYVLINPDDIGVIYASIVSFDKKSSESCIKSNIKILNTLRYKEEKGVY